MLRIIVTNFIVHLLVAAGSLIGIHLLSKVVLLLHQSLSFLLWDLSF